MKLLPKRLEKFVIYKIEREKEQAKYLMITSCRLHPHQKKDARAGPFTDYYVRTIESLVPSTSATHDLLK